MENAAVQPPETPRVPPDCHAACTAAPASRSGRFGAQEPLRLPRRPTCSLFEPSELVSSHQRWHSHIAKHAAYGTKAVRAVRHRLLQLPTVLHLKQRQPAPQPWAAPLLPREQSPLALLQLHLVLRPLPSLPLPRPAPPLPAQLQLRAPLPPPPHSLPLALPAALLRLPLLLQPLPAGWCMPLARGAAAQ